MPDSHSRLPAVVSAARRPASAEAILDALPVPSYQQMAIELCGSLSLTTLFAVISTLVVIALGRLSEPSTTGEREHEWLRMGSIFFLTVAVCWGVLIPAKLWTTSSGDDGKCRDFMYRMGGYVQEWRTRHGDCWKRRTTMLMVGVLVGLGALWIDGWLPQLPTAEAAIDSERPIRRWSCASGGPLIVAQYLSYFGLAFFIMRWWKLADRHRDHWFCLGPIFVTALWGFVSRAWSHG